MPTLAACFENIIPVQKALLSCNCLVNAANFWASHALVNSGSHFHPGQRASTFSSGPTKGLYCYRIKTPLHSSGYKAGRSASCFCHPGNIPSYIFVGLSVESCLPCCPRDCRLWTMVEDFQVPFQDPGWEMAKAGHKYFYYSYLCGFNLDGGWVSSCFRQNLLKWLPYLFAELSRPDWCRDIQNEGRGGRLLSWFKWPRESSEDYFSARKFLRYLLGTHGIYSSDRLTNIYSNSIQMQVSPPQLLAYTLVF